MPTTNYDVADLANEQIIVNSFTNASNIGGPAPSVNIQGSFSDAAFALTGAQVSNSESCAGALTYLYDIDHTSPIDPVQPGAHITRITIRVQTSNLAANGSASATFPVEGPIGFPGGHVNSNAQVIVTILPVPMDTSLGTLTNVNESDSDSSNPDGTGLKSCSSAASHAGVICGFDIDFTTNPGGMFPLGYMSYDDFLINFTNMIFAFNTTATGGAQWFAFSPPDHPTPATGSVSGSATLLATNFSMDVEWSLPVSWTFTPSTLNLPDNIITFTRPPLDDGVEDTEEVESITLGDFTINPNDPWVEIWTKYRIIIHFPPLEDDGTDIPVYVDIIGTEFTGHVLLGPLTVNTADLSGIYSFDIDQHKDTLYDRTSTPTTQDVAIPAPFFVTAFQDTPEADIQHSNGTRIRATGQGSLKQIMQSYDYVNTQELVDMILRTRNNKSPVTLANFIDQQIALRVYMDALDDYMNVSEVLIFTKVIFTEHPH